MTQTYLLLGAAWIMFGCMAAVALSARRRSKSRAMTDDAEYWLMVAGNFRWERDQARAEVAALKYKLEQIKRLQIGYRRNATQSAP